jgi:hypothetical protein
MQHPHKKIPKSVLKLILKEFIKEGFDYDDMQEIYASSKMDKMDSILKKFGLSTYDYEDYGFYAELFMENVSGETINEDLIIPQLKKFNIYFAVSVKKWVDEKWELPMNSFSKKFIQDMLYNGDMSYYDGTMYEDDVNDTETNDWDITSIEEDGIVESKKTEKIIRENRDMELARLMKMKKLIEQRINNLI